MRCASLLMDMISHSSTFVNTFRSLKQNIFACIGPAPPHLHSTTPPANAQRTAPPGGIFPPRLRRGNPLYRRKNKKGSY